MIAINQKFLLRLLNNLIINLYRNYYYYCCCLDYFSMPERDLKILCLPAKSSYFYPVLANPSFSVTFASNVRQVFDLNVLLRFRANPARCTLAHSAFRPRPTCHVQRGWLSLTVPAHLTVVGFPFSSLRRPVHRIGRGGALPKLPSQLHSRPDVPLFRDGAEGIR